MRELGNTETHHCSYTRFRGGSSSFGSLGIDNSFQLAKEAQDAEFGQLGGQDAPSYGQGNPENDEDPSFSEAVMSELGEIGPGPDSDDYLQNFKHESLRESARSSRKKNPWDSLSEHGIQSSDSEEVKALKALERAKQKKKYLAEYPDSAENRAKYRDQTMELIQNGREELRVIREKQQKEEEALFAELKSGYNQYENAPGRLHAGIEGSGSHIDRYSFSDGPIVRMIINFKDLKPGFSGCIRKDNVTVLSNTDKLNITIRGLLADYVVGEEGPELLREGDPITYYWYHVLRGEVIPSKTRWKIANNALVVEMTKKQSDFVWSDLKMYKFPKYLTQDDPEHSKLDPAIQAQSDYYKGILAAAELDRDEFGQKSAGRAPWETPAGQHGDAVPLPTRYGVHSGDPVPDWEEYADKQEGRLSELDSEVDH